MPFSSIAPTLNNREAELMEITQQYEKFEAVVLEQIGVQVSPMVIDAGAGQTIVVGKEKDVPTSVYFHIFFFKKKLIY